MTTYVDDVEKGQRHLGQQLATRRAAAGLNQADLGRRISYNRTTIAHAERGNQIPSARFWEACDRALDANGTLLALYEEWHEAKAQRERESAAREQAERWQRLRATEDVDSGILDWAAPLSGNIVEHSMTTDVLIDGDGWATVTYVREIVNLTDRPVARIPSVLWFEHTRDNRLRIRPVSPDDHRVMIQRVHDSEQFSKFACQLTPPIPPGGTAKVSYVCNGGRFVADHYWRQFFQRHTRRYRVTITHDVPLLMRCSALEELADGSESVITDELSWDQSETGVSITLVRDDLIPGQALTVRWDADHDAS